MKKLFAIAAVVAVAFTSCVKNEVITPDNEISFKAVNYKNTKAEAYGPIASTTYPTDEHFGVYAFSNFEPTVQYMQNVEIEKVGADWKNATKNYYWPKEATNSLDFVAYSPFNLDPCQGTVTATYNKGIAIEDFTTTADLARQVDLMVSNVVEDQTSADGVVGIAFKHVLSQIRFTAAPKANDYDIDGITVNSVKFTVKSQADYAQTGTAVQWDAWSGHNVDLNYEALNGVQTVDITSAAAQAISVPLLIIPQNAVEITVNYTINYGNGHIENCEAKYTPAANWQMNKIYTYNLTIGLDEITFSPVVVDWDAAGVDETINE